MKKILISIAAFCFLAAAQAGAQGQAAPDAMNKDGMKDDANKDGMKKDEMGMQKSGDSMEKKSDSMAK